jgi:hypothetical protein
MKEVSDNSRVYSAQFKLLRELGIDSLNRFRILVLDPRSSRLIASKTGVDSKKLLRWLNHKDMYRVKGINRDYLMLLEKADIFSTSKLATCNADELNNTLILIDSDGGGSGKLPGLIKVINWINQAKSLPAILF